ncbi:hypothetical protein NQ318_005654 [Aromia moschata]|uniref:Uncharacterized protein n=1 Tax=Aromia moschata TaxID=1265417 RepID=A0AAV8XYV6_9CUCU|nr:hypothetical protein NQ318_005654 [Aromia moschata]
MERGGLPDKLRKIPNKKKEVSVVDRDSSGPARFCEIMANRCQDNPLLIKNILFLTKQHSS